MWQLIIVLLIVALAVVGFIRAIFPRKKKNTPPQGCRSCSGCPGCKDRP